jgi:hypothetical protein
MTEQLSPIQINEPSLKLFSAYLEQPFTKEELANLADQFRRKTIEETKTFYGCVSEGLFLYPRMQDHSHYHEILQLLLKNKG